MKTVWFITNPKSGTATPAKAKALEAICKERGLVLAGRTAFPDEPLPTPRALDAAGVDTAILFAGDGTINAAVTALLDWRGAILILPGGTMNLLAKLLHGNTDPARIIIAAHAKARKMRLPFVRVGDNRAFVGLILGPAASWVRAREIVRSGRLRGLGRALKHAWSRTFGKGIRLEGVAGLKHGAQAVLVRAETERLDIAAIDARDFRAITALGWEWLTGDWVVASEVTQCHATSFRTRGHKPALALFDGEPVMLEPGSEVGLGQTRDLFLTTLER